MMARKSVSSGFGQVQNPITYMKADDGKTREEAKTAKGYLGATF
jgi:hypothetical protein